MRRPEFTLSRRRFQQDAIAWLVATLQLGN